MMKFTATSAVDGRPVLVLGLSDENVRRMSREGGSKPMVVHCEEMGLPPIDIVIFRSPTEKDMLEAFATMIGPRLHGQD